MSDNHGSLCTRGRKREETELFYEELQKYIVTKSDHLIISGDLHARMGQRLIPEVVGIFGESTLNNNGHALRQFGVEENSDQSLIM